MNTKNTFITRKLVSYSAAGKQPEHASFAVGVGVFPYLADHGFQGMIVLPGAFYVEMALGVHLECLHASLGAIKRVEFLNPVILSNENVALAVRIQRLDDGTIQYSFHEVDQANADPFASRPCARVEIETKALLSTDETKSAFDVAAFQQQANFHANQTAFYHRLSENGNQYGPQFQRLHQVWRSDQEALGRLHVPSNDSSTGNHSLHPILIDGAAQLLASFLLDQGRTFILQGIEELAVFQSRLPEDVWVHGRLRPQTSANNNGWFGDLDVFDDAGRSCLRFKGVSFTYLDKTAPEEPVAPAKTEIVIASTFTAEPIEESLLFWGDYLGLPVQVGFAPYNQVFQQLLSPDSQLRRNQKGFNAILLNLSDWAEAGHAFNLKLTPEKAAACFGDLPRHILPNGLEVAHLNRHETEYVYKEIFDDRVYLRHGIRLTDEATVIDIGANIGLFSLFVRSRAPRASVYAFEPSPVAFRALKANCEAHGSLLRPFNVGVSERRGSAKLTFYEKSSVFSSFHSDVEEDRKAIQAVVANMVQKELGGAEPIDEYVGELMADRMDRQTFECPLVSVSDIIRDNGLQRVNLLKVDAEKCELEILRGIDASHWPLIDQVVIEVHDRTRKMVEEVQDILSKQGFECAVEEENLLTGSGLFNVYANREKDSSQNETDAHPDLSLRDEVQGKVDQFVQALDSFTQSASAPTVVCVCPANHKKSPDTAFTQQLAEIETDLLNRIRNFSQVQVISSASILESYPTAEFHDPHANDAGHIPYTQDGFAAIGTRLFRTFTGLRRPPFKVIVLDCDNTLWQGTCGEDGPLGVIVTPAHRTLQEFMIRQMNAGMLLCLCSKNSEADVWAVFDQNQGMMLKREHLVAWRINWSPKSENLQSLTAELNLGLESVIFVDDNPVECAEVKSNCPSALTLQLPTNAQDLPAFLAHTWAFDHLHTTTEDHTRTTKMQENVQRTKYREQFSTLKDFIDGLQLEVEIFEPTRDQLPRVSQLTFRTNQFNFTTLRRSENEIARHLEVETNRCLAVNVRDRFGDYGMVGLLIYRADADRFTIDTFLLSCRVLGRGVEHQILAHLGREAQQHGRKWVELPFRTTDKNQPAKEFVESISAAPGQKYEGATLFSFSAENLAALRYEPNAPSTSRSLPEPKEIGVAASSNTALAMAGLSEKFQQIASDLHGVTQIRASLEAARLRTTGFLQTAVVDDSPVTLEGKMLAIWRKAIGNPNLGIADNFFDAGGTSLKAVQVIAAVRRELKLQLSIVSLFECPTVRLLCEKLEPGKTSNTSADDAMARGARRKQRIQKRG